VTTLVTQHFGAPASARDARAQLFARSRAVDELAGRTVWCASGLPRGLEQAGRLRGSLVWADADGVAAGALAVPSEDPARDAALLLDGMLGGEPSAAHPGASERDAYRGAAGSGDALLDADVRADDVVVLHDALAAVMAGPIRERGAHTVWRVQLAGPGGERLVSEALRFLREYTSGVDAYVVTWDEDSGRGVVAHEIGALMPSADVLAAKDVVGESSAEDLAWGCLLADVVHGDRWESVGGRVHVRPVVAAR
jgi:hypothetical protein